MARARGSSRNTFLSMKFESSYGVDPGGNYKKLPFVSAGVGADEDFEDNPILGLGRDPQDAVEQLLREGGDIVVPLDLRNIGYWFKLCMGAPITWDLGSGNYGHYFGSGISTLPSAAIEIGMGDVPAYLLNLGIQVDSWSLSVTRQGVPVLRMQVRGQDEQKNATAQSGTLSAAETLTQFKARQGNIQRAGSDLASVLSAELNFGNSLDAVETLRSDALVEGFDPGETSFGGTIQSRFASTTLYDDATTPNYVKLGWLYTIGATQKLTVQSRRVRLLRGKLPLSGPGGVEASNQWRASVASLTAITDLAATKVTGGSLSDDEYFYEVTAVDVNGVESLISNEDSDTTETTNNTVRLTWTAVDGALSYNVYRSTTTATYGATSFLANVTAATYDDDGSVSLTTGTPPTTSDAGHACEIILLNDVAAYTI